MNMTLSVVIAVASLTAAGFWFWASHVVKVPDNMDTFIGELQRIGKFNSRAALSAGIAASALAAQTALNILGYL